VLYCKGADNVVLERLREAVAGSAEEEIVKSSKLHT
jgi:hypothetical protein